MKARIFFYGKTKTHCVRCYFLCKPEKEVCNQELCYLCTLLMVLEILNGGEGLCINKIIFIIIINIKCNALEIPTGISIQD